MPGLLSKSPAMKDREGIPEASSVSLAAWAAMTKDEKDNFRHALATHQNSCDSDRGGMKGENGGYKRRRMDISVMTAGACGCKDEITALLPVNSTVWCSRLTLRRWERGREGRGGRAAGDGSQRESEGWVQSVWRGARCGVYSQARLLAGPGAGWNHVT